MTTHNPDLAKSAGVEPVLPTGPRRPAAAESRPVTAVLPHAQPARAKRRHYVLAASFFLCVLAPFFVVATYLYTSAQDQFASTIAFTVRSEEGSVAGDLLGGLSRSFGAPSAHDSDILYAFIHSQTIVENIDAQLDLRNLYSLHADTDPVFSYDGTGTIEDLTRYWKRMVKVSYDAASGLIEVRAHAFLPQDAFAVSQAILQESHFVINEISASSREDATRYSDQELQRAETRLRDARQALTSFRLQHRVVDPTQDIDGQMGLIANLEEQLAKAMIDYDLLAATAQKLDHRLTQAQRRIEVIEKRIFEERNKFSAADGDTGFVATVSEFERLTVDHEFAQATYMAARSAHDISVAEAQRNSRYLATFVAPTFAERAEYPLRATMLALVGLFLLLGWSIVVLIYYSLRDRR